MTEHFAFGSYVPGKSAVHETRAQVKIILACVFSIGVFFVDSWGGVGAIASVPAILYLLARIPLSRGARGLGPILFILVFTVIVHSLSFTLAGFLDGLLVATRIAVIVLTCGLITFTTPAVELVDGLLWLIGPLRCARVPVDDVATVISLALRFIPLTAQEAYMVRRAQLARGADFEARSPLNRTKAWVPVLVPLMVRLFRRSEILGSALESRCYSGGARTHLHVSRMRPQDWLVLIIGIALLLAICVFF